MEQQEFLSPQLQSFFEAESATVGQRLLNYLVDVVILYIAALGLGIMLAIATYISGEPDDPGGFFQELLLILIILFTVLYYAFVEGASRGRSVGKLITCTKVVKDDGSEISWKDAFIRSLCRLIPFEPFTAFGGYPLHDRLSHTKVVKIKK